MSTKSTRSGGKFTGSHTTLISVAVIVADIANNCPVVTKIAIGYIKNGLRSINGRRSLKIINKNSEILLSVRDNKAHQEIHVYSKETQVAMLEIAKGAREKNLHVYFGNNKKTLPTTKCCND